jgi:hypothetical protein
MKFYIIYSFDCKRNISVERFKPPFIRKWDLTEGDEQYEYDYLDGDYKNGKHRKYTAELNKEQFKQFVDDCCLYMEDVETMGSLTIEYGHLPAFSFNGENEFAIWQKAYVTPFPEHVDPNKQLNYEKRYNDHNWDRLKRAMLKEFGL